MNKIHEECVVLDHGTGGLLSGQLVSDVIVGTLGDVYVGLMEDSFVAKLDTVGFLAMTTDSFVITPQIFGNGDIGKVAVCGTVNDLAVSGATPKFLTLALVLEEGLPIRTLRQIIASVRDAALEANVKIVAGDTKVVKCGEVDKIFINTAGVGFVPDRYTHLRPRSIRDGDDIIVSSSLGNHSIHILSMREGLGFEQRVLSDCAPLNHMLDSLLARHAAAIRCMRDVTRGGLGTVLNELATEQSLLITLDEERLPIQIETRMASEMLGVNPIYLANEGCVCLFADPAYSADIVAELKKHTYGRQAAVVGRTRKATDGKVLMIDRDGDSTIVEHLQGMELPRLC
ncbi:hydrogenase expression/formation protein HypE (plasmid) [Rhizobium leguminosarum bv. trifolii WSM2304]|uniref:Hydrogenase expression/formation protein HypE n=1 Tax=Rhizobium leguminosarum bv. trifolii (strain WSM2304) TaxID=395492 RepID=A0ABF7QYZ1_RHILW|nr:hydrogenase expression/formation protein HypE [Rhizobium leguminosarum]ACI59554.1 hydrogenase expression/formation protein HypE [Rhizobium leguminosarum bv. trifolii WSM2304]